MSSKMGKHQSISKDLKRSILWLMSIDEVRRLILGVSEACRHSYAPGVLRVRHRLMGGVAVNAYGGKGITTIYVQISPPEAIPEVERLIGERFE